MGSRKTWRHVCLWVVVGADIACSDGTGPKSRPAPNAVRLQSDAGDYIGAGETHSYTQANAVITVVPGGAHLSVKVAGDQWWNGDFQAPAGASRLEPGTYTGLSRYLSYDTAKGGISWFGEGRGCLVVIGSFTIDSITYVADSLRKLDLRFEQHCEGGSPALRGSVHWRPNDATRPAGPAKIPSNLWQPPRGATPASGDYVYLQSEPGDFLGGGQTVLLTEPTTSIAVAATTIDGAGRVSVSAGAWYGIFLTMNTLSQVKTGYYANLQESPVHNPTRAEVDWTGNGRACSGQAGWFAVDRIAYVNGAPTTLELRFEQHCTPGAPALRGKVRWTK